jgi:hypothetical protein
MILEEGFRATSKTGMVVSVLASGLWRLLHVFNQTIESYGCDIYHLY